jgi:hypothetical protein
MYIQCWFCIIKYTFCIKNDVNTIEGAFNLGENKTYTLPSGGFFFITLWMFKQKHNNWNKKVKYKHKINN